MVGTRERGLGKEKVIVLGGFLRLGARWGLGLVFSFYL